MDQTVDDLLAATRTVLNERAVFRFDEPIELASGKMSTTFIDGKAGLSRPEDLRLACQAMHALVDNAGIFYNAVGGLTLGADHLAVGTSLVGGKEWFIVRKQAKGRGTAKRIEGAELNTDSRVLVVEDVVSTGGSLLQAIDVIEEAGATVVAATTLIDRGDVTAPVLADRGIAYFPLASYSDFGLDPVTAT